MLQDANLIVIQCSEIYINNNTFNGKSDGNAPIKITKRGIDGDVLSDIPYYANAINNLAN